MHKTFCFKYMTVVVARLTRYIWAKASRRLPSSEDLMSMLESLEQETGYNLKHITSDRGSQFCSRFWMNKCKSKQLISIETSVSHPQADGITERAAQTILNKLRQSSVNNEKKWYKKLLSSVFAVNNSTSAATKMVTLELIEKISK
jgi:transposase InsO family protein